VPDPDLTLDDLARQLDTELGIAGRNRVTRNVIRQWVRWGFLDHAVPRGRSVGLRPVWQRDEDQRARARRLAELRLAGVKTERLLICQGWLEGWDIPFRDASTALAEELTAQLNRASRTNTSNFDARGGAPVSHAKRRAVLRQAGPPNSEAEPFIAAIGPERLFASLAAARFGREGKVDLAELFLAGVAILAVAPVGPEDRPIAEAVVSGLYGLLGSPDEIGDSALETLKSASVGDFGIARALLTAVRELLEELAVRPTKNSELIQQTIQRFFVGRAAVSTYAYCLHSIHSAGERRDFFVKAVETILASVSDLRAPRNDA